MIIRFTGRNSAAAQLVFLSFIHFIPWASAAAFDKRDAHVLADGRFRNLDSKDFQQPSVQGGVLQQVPLSHAGDGERVEDMFGNITAYPSAYAALLDAVQVMESHFFQVSQGTWPQAIDWTAAVMGTHVSATLSAMTEYTQSLKTLSSPLSTEEARDHENLINRYFTQITSFYFGENAFALRIQAYDDMLWVVLGWLESVKFINLHSSLHYNSSSQGGGHENHGVWYASQFIPQFAHRSRLFYDLASRGWDTTLCGGGMTWNPYITPYKNAITNELYIAASVGMYLYFPGDSNPSPFPSEGLPPAEAHDTKDLDNAVEGYKWLKSSGMRNGQGLYVDGFHITGWRGGTNGSNGTGNCDLRNEDVYTYNQGVLLSGLKGLWEATGSRQYLEDGHELIRNVIRATGWQDRDTERKYRWAGLGRNGVLEETCDWSGTCNQDGQTFKGIFFHHLTLFCSPLARRERGDEKNTPADDNDDAWLLHQKTCDEYAGWIRHNAFAAYVTRNDDGEFGEWWGRPVHGRRGHSENEALFEKPGVQGSDYRNQGVPKNEIWRLPEDDSMHEGPDAVAWELVYEPAEKHQHRDLNDRGRGRTVETQSGGLAVIRAFWTLVEARRHR